MTTSMSRHATQPTGPGPSRRHGPGPAERAELPTQPYHLPDSLLDIRGPATVAGTVRLPPDPPQVPAPSCPPADDFAFFAPARTDPAPPAPGPSHADHPVPQQTPGPDLAAAAFPSPDLAPAAFPSPALRPTWDPQLRLDPDRLVHPGPHPLGPGHPHTRLV
ncbi:MAG TPA: hypothetical protein VFP72_23335, partial [Kineosporiaceae bacterium]|nr:hypothetical protein [Kineosporiaceae bacterium]